MFFFLCLTLCIVNSLQLVVGGSDLSNAVPEIQVRSRVQAYSILNNYLLSFPATTPPRMWAVSCVSNLSNINEPTGCDNRKLPDETTTYICFSTATYFKVMLIKVALYCRFLALRSLNFFMHVIDYKLKYFQYIHKFS
jgi:hypothetical protein